MTGPQIWRGAALRGSHNPRFLLKTALFLSNLDPDPKPNPYQTLLLTLILSQWDGWLDADAEGAAAEISALLRVARVNATVDPNDVNEHPAAEGASSYAGLLALTSISVFACPQRTHGTCDASKAHCMRQPMECIACVRDPVHTSTCLR